MMIDIFLPKDNKELARLLDQANPPSGSNWRKTLLALPVVLVLLAGCAKGKDTVTVSAAALSTATPTTEVTPPPTLIAPPESTPKASVQPTQWLPTQRVVEPTAKPTERVLRNGGLFTEKVNVGYGIEYTGKIGMPDGTFMSVPITVGLEYGVEKPTLHGFKKVELDPDYVNERADSFMHTCWWRFTHLMKGNETVGYEEYLKLVKQGKGMVEIMAVDESGKSTKTIPQVLKFDPRLGFSMVLADNRNLTLDMGNNTYIHLGISAENRLFFASSIREALVEGYYSFYSNKPLADTVYINDSFTSLFSIIGKAPNSCLTGNGKLCTVRSPSSFWEIVGNITDKQWEDLEKGKIAPMAVFSP